MKIKNGCLLSAVAAVIFPVVANGAAVYEWTFNDGTLSDSFSNGIMAAVGGTVPNVVDTNGGSIPHIGGVQARVLNVPQFLNLGEGFNLTLAATGPNGFGAYVNQYTIIFDLYSPGGAGWQALFQTNPDNPATNDADWYIAPDAALGIGALVYSPAGTIAQDTWYRIGFSADLAAGRVTYYVNGTPVVQRNGGPLTDGRFALFSNLDAGADLRLFNEGDESGVYTHALYVNSIAFADSELSAVEMSLLGGPDADGILIPEPGTGCLALAAVSALVLRRRRVA